MQHLRRPGVIVSLKRRFALTSQVSSLQFARYQFHVQSSITISRFSVITLHCPAALVVVSQPLYIRLDASRKRRCVKASPSACHSQHAPPHCHGKQGQMSKYHAQRPRAMQPLMHASGLGANGSDVRWLDGQIFTKICIMIICEYVFDQWRCCIQSMKEVSEGHLFLETFVFSALNKRRVCLFVCLFKI